MLAIKIDNIAQARPRTGLTDAGIVYVLRASAQLLAEARGASTAQVVERETLAPAVVS